MDNFGILLFSIAVLAIFAVDVLSMSYLKTALLDLRMRKPGFFVGSAAICLFSILLSSLMAGAFLDTSAEPTYGAIDAPTAGVLMTEQKNEGATQPSLDFGTNENASAIVGFDEGNVIPEGAVVDDGTLNDLGAGFGQAGELESGATGNTEENTMESTAAVNEPEQNPAKTEAETKTETKTKTETETKAETEKPTKESENIGPTLSVWRGFYKDFTYNFIEIENGTPYVYMPINRGNFQTNLNNITANREGGNILVMANAGLFDTATTEPLGTTIQNGIILSQGGKSDFPRTLVVDEAGNVGYTAESIENGTASYIDARTGETVTEKKIVSAVHAFSPIVLNGKAATEYKDKVANYAAYRPRQIFCVKQDSYVIITNTGEGEENGGWNFDDMTTVAYYRGCVSAFNLDGGGSTATAYRSALNRNFSILATTLRRDPTFIVFTADNLAPRGR